MRTISKLTLAITTAAMLAAGAAIAQTAPATKPAATASAPAATLDMAKITDLMKTAATAKLDNEGYIRDWLILAPIGYGEKYNAEDIDKESVKGEAAFTPKAGEKIKVSSEEGEPGAFKTVQKEIEWKAVNIKEDFFDFNEICKIDVSDSMGGYAVAYLDAPEELKGIKLSLCSNDNGKIYLNGKSIYSFVGGRSLSEDTDVVENMTLNKGINVLVFKVWNDSNAWQGCLRLLTKDDKPVKNVTVRIPK
jgi:hypothetical protein